MDATTTRATRREWTGLAVLALPTLLLSLDISVLYLALPHLTADLGATGSQQLWILDIYSFMLAGFLVTMGTLGDRIGRRRLLLIGASCFGVASVLCAYSWSPEMLIVARALLGIAGATLMPSSMALIRNMFADPQQMGKALGVWFACFMGGQALGPVVGGVLLEQFWWGAVFLLGVPVMVVLLVAAPVLLPEYRDENAGKLDLTSVALSLLAILPVIYGFKELARDGWSAISILTVLVGVGVGVLFVRRQRRLDDPLLDVRLFRQRTFSTALAVMLLGGILMAGATLMSTLYLQVASGLSPLRAGLWMVPENIALIIASVVGPMLAGKIRPSHVVALGIALAGAGLLVQTLVPTNDGIPVLVTGLVIASFGVALPMPVTMNLMLSSAPPERAGSASSMQETSGEFGVAVGVAAMGSLGTLVYRSQLADTMPAGVPAETAEAASESLASAVTVAPELADAVRTDFLETAREAFTTGLNVVAGVGGTLFLGMAVLAALVLRRADDSAEHTEHTQQNDAETPTG